MELRFVFKSSSGKPRLHAKRLPVLVGRSDAPADDAPAQDDAGRDDFLKGLP